MEWGTKSKLCVVYSRISSWSQMEWWGLSSQETRCEQYTKMNWYTTINSFRDEWISWWLLERPAIRSLFAFVDQYNKANTEKITILVTDDISRFARDYTVHLELKKELLRRGMKLETVNMKFEATPVGKFIEWIMALNSQLFRENNAQNVTDKDEARLIKWYRPFCYPIGFKTEKAIDGWKLLIRDEPNATIITEALELYADDVLNSLQDVVRFFERKWLQLHRKQAGKTWPIKIYKTLVSRILKNILYSGHIEYTKTTRDRKTGFIKNNWNVSLREWQHEWFITLETYYKIQDKLNGKGKQYPKLQKKVNDNFPLRWFLACDCCGLPLSSGISRWKTTRVPYYTFNKKCACKNKSINAVNLHDKFDHVVKDLAVDRWYLDFLKETIMEEQSVRKTDKLSRTKWIEQEIVELNDKIDNTVNIITTSQSQLVIKKLEEKVEEYESRKNMLLSNIVLSKNNISTKSIDIAFDVLEDPYDIRKTGNVDAKRAFLQLVFRNNLLINKKKEGFWTLPFSSFYLLNHQFSDVSVLVGGDDGVRTHV